MSTTIKYKGLTIAELEAGSIGTIACNGKEMESDLIVIAPESESSGDADALLAEVDDYLDTINGERIGEDSYTVTFYDENGVQLYQQAVIVGDDCDDPVVTGKISKPSKENTNTQNFTFSGWSLTQGGSASSAALKNITSDRAVYAAYTATTRYYTVRFFDGETLLKTETHEYGASSTYTYDKLGANFTGWTPSPTNISSDMDCYGEWIFASFTTDTWEDIIANSEAGRAADVYSVGDVKEMTFTLGGKSETIIVQIVGFNEDTLADGSGKAGMTIIAKTALSTPKPFNTIPYSDAYTSYAYKGYGESELKTYIDDQVLNALSFIPKAVTKKYNYYTNGLNGTEQQGTTSVRVWIPSIDELGLGYVGTLGYEVYVDDNSRIVTLNDTPVQYWTRTIHGMSTVDFILAEGVNPATGLGAQYESHIVIGFCV